MKFVGYAVVSKDDELLTGSEKDKDMLTCTHWIDETYPDLSPSRTVRVLIDEIEDDKKI